MARANAYPNLKKPENYIKNLKNIENLLLNKKVYDPNEKPEKGAFEKLRSIFNKK